MANPYFLRVAYVGTDFFGWQIQTSLRSVQAELWKAVQAFDPQAPMPAGTGRTDAGVHARAQGVLVQLGRAWEPYRLLAAINARLPWDVRVLTAQPAPDGFFPRAHAAAKRYVYRIQEGPAADPFHHLRRWHVYGAEALGPGRHGRRRRPPGGRPRFLQLPPLGMRGPHPAPEGLPDRAGRRRAGAGPGVRRQPLPHAHGADHGRDPGGGGEGALPGRGSAGHPRRPGPPAGGDHRAPHGLCLDQVWYQRRWGIGDPSPWPEDTE